MCFKIVDTNFSLNHLHEATVVLGHTFVYLCSGIFWNMTDFCILSMKFYQKKCYFFNWPFGHRRESFISLNMFSNIATFLHYTHAFEDIKKTFQPKKIVKFDMLKINGFGVISKIVLPHQLQTETSKPWKVEHFYTYRKYLEKNIRELFWKQRNLNNTFDYRPSGSSYPSRPSSVQTVKYFQGLKKANFCL